MSQMTDYLEKKLLDHTLGKAAYTMPATVYLALFTADPTDTGSLAAEVSVTSTGYARQAITAAMPAASATGGQSANTTAITFGPASAAWGTITHLGICDASTGGNMLLFAALTASKTIASADSLQFAIGQFTVTFA